MTGREQVSRRMFLRQSSVFTAGAISGAILTEGGACAGRRKPSAELSGPAKILNQQPQMRYRRLGKTNLVVSEIVLGGHFNDPHGQPYWDHFADGELPADVARNRTEVVAKCLDYGINFLDITNGGEALAYGAALQGRRDRIYIAADDGQYAMRQERHRNAEGQMRTIESCLVKLRTDYLDLWRPQFKYTGGHRDLDMEMCLGVFEKARQQGKVRFLGMSTHDRAWAQHVLKKFPAYAVLYIPYTLKSKVKPAALSSIDRTQLYEPPDQEWWLQDRRPGLFELAHKQDVGVITTKPFSAGLIFSVTRQEFGRPDRVSEADRELARLTLAYILANPDLSGVAVGMLLPSHVDNNVRACTERHARLEPQGLLNLQKARQRLEAQLAPEYGWLRQWEHV